MATSTKLDPDLMRTTVVLEKDLVAWAKTQPGGLSLMMRALLRQMKDGKIKLEYPVKRTPIQKN